MPPAFSTLRTEIAGVPVARLAGKFGTPLYVYDAAMIRRRIDDLQAFDTVRYAVKACSNLAILDLVRRQGAIVDTVSAGEIRRALAAGFSAEPSEGGPPPIVYCSDIFDAEALELVVEKNVHVTCGSPDMIAQLAARAPGQAITLRINPGFGHGHSRKTNTGGDTSKHGIWHEQLPDCLAAAQRGGLEVVGAHVHIGSGADIDHLAQVAGAMEKIATAIGPSIQSISAGGGLSTPYRPGETPVDVNAYYRVWNDARRRLEDRFGHAVRLEIEPGRYLVAESGYLVAEIRGVKRQAQSTYYLVNAGFNDLARPVLYGAYHPIAVCPADGRVVQREVEEADVIVGGPLCESGDIFTQAEGGYVVTRRLPDAKVGDFLVIECAGAYGASMSSNYNSRPLAAEVLLDSATPRLIRRRQTFDEMTAAER